MTGLLSVFADLGSNSDECVAKPNIDSGDRILIFMDVSPPTEAFIQQSRDKRLNFQVYFNSTKRLMEEC